jgi:MFS transporter, BCD family, chlorophyll transporter
MMTSAVQPVSANSLSWLGIVRLGLVQAALGAIVVLTTSTINRVMVVELMLPAIIPGALVALHHALQLLRPRMGHGSDVGGRGTPWIVGGMAVLAVGGVLSATATVLMGTNFTAGIALAVLAFALIGAGVSASGTSLLVLVAKRVAPNRKPAAAAIIWILMISGFVITATVAGKFLDPFSPSRLVTVASCVSAIAFLIAVLAVWGVEGDIRTQKVVGDAVSLSAKQSFMSALKDVWAEPQARHFTIFVFVSMFAYNAQDLILEPFAGSVFNFTVGQSTRLSGLQHGGVLLGMISVGAIATMAWGKALGSLKFWMVSGCIGSGIALLGLVIAGSVGPTWPFKANVFLLGLANGAFSIAAVASMMSMASNGRESREGVRMGLWGASQAIAFGLGSFFGAAMSDMAKLLLGSPAAAYSTVFAFEAVLFLVAAALAYQISSAKDVRQSNASSKPSDSISRDSLVASLTGRA